MEKWTSAELLEKGIIGIDYTKTNNMRINGVNIFGITRDEVLRWDNITLSIKFYKDGELIAEIVLFPNETLEFVYPGLLMVTRK
jgi:hypothetical protein